MGYIMSERIVPEGCLNRKPGTKYKTYEYVIGKKNKFVVPTQYKYVVESFPEEMMDEEIFLFSPLIYIGDRMALNVMTGKIEHE